MNREFFDLQFDRLKKIYPAIPDTEMEAYPKTRLDLLYTHMNKIDGIEERLVKAIDFFILNTQPLPPLMGEFEEFFFGIRIEELKQEIIEQLSLDSPVCASLFSFAEINYETHPVNPTIHITAKRENLYQYEQMRSSAMWPRIHLACKKVLNSELTLNFQDPK